MGRNYVACGVLIGLAWAASAAAQQNPDAQRAALKEIRDTAADICYTVEQKGSKSEAQLSGEVQAKVNGAIAKLADIGVKGSGQVDSMEYQGVSQEALGTALTASVNCRERVFDKLLDRMLPAASSSKAIPHQASGSGSSINGPRQQTQSVSNGGVEVTIQNCQSGADTLQCLATVECIEHECRFALYGTYAPKGAHSMFIPDGSNLPYQARVGLNTPHDLGGVSNTLAASTPTRAYLTFHDLPPGIASGKLVVSYSANGLPGRAEFQLNLPQ